MVLNATGSNNILSLNVRKTITDWFWSTQTGFTIRNGKNALKDLKNLKYKIDKKYPLNKHVFLFCIKCFSVLFVIILDANCLMHFIYVDASFQAPSYILLCNSTEILRKKNFFWVSKAVAGNMAFTHYVWQPLIMHGTYHFKLAIPFSKVNRTTG